MRRNPYTVLALAVATVSFASLFIRLSHAPPLPIATYRMGFATLILAAALVATDRQAWRGLHGREWGLCLLSGFCLALHFGTWVTSLSYTSVASSTVLVSMQPLFVMAGSHFLYRERVPRLALAAAALAVAGSALIGGGDFGTGGRALWGDLLAFTGSITVAGYMLIGRLLRQQMSLLAYTVPVYASCTLFLILGCLFGDQPLTPYPPGEWLLFLALAVVPTIGGHTLFNYTLRYLAAHVVSISTLGEPVGASLLVLGFLGEVPPLPTVLGAVLALSGIGWFLWLTAPSPSRPRAGRGKATGEYGRSINVPPGVPAGTGAGGDATGVS